MSQDDVERVARAICAEKCAYMGEPACWTFKEETWPPPACDEPGCVSEARAALSALPARELLAEALDALEPFAESLVAQTDVTHHSQDWREETDNTVVSIKTSHQRKGMPDLSPDHTLWVGAFRRARAAADKIRAALTQEKQT